MGNAGEVAISVLNEMHVGAGGDSCRPAHTDAPEGEHRIDIPGALL